MSGVVAVSVLLVTFASFGVSLMLFHRVRSLHQSASALIHTTASRQGALVPASSSRLFPDLSKIILEPIPNHLFAQAALVIEFNEQLSSDLKLRRINDQLSTIKGPLASAISSLLKNPKVMDTALGKAGYYIVKASPGVQFMTANGAKVAQERGVAGLAGKRAVIIGGSAIAIAPELIAVALAFYAEYILTVNVERIGKIAELVHQRQLAEALSTSDQVLQLIQRLRQYENPTEWPEVLVSPLVTAHHELCRQTFAATRLRESILNNDLEGKLQPADPTIGDKSSAFYELAAGYEIHAVAAQAAAARLVHALAHGDDVTTAELEWQLHDHIKNLSEHHKAIDDLTNRKSRWFKQGWGRTLKGLREAHGEIISLVEAREYQFGLVFDGSKAEMFALPAAPIYLPETAPLSDTAGE